MEGIDPEKVLKEASKYGDAEIFHLRNDWVCARYNLDYIEAGLSDVSEGVGVRVVKNGRMGHSYFTNPRDMKKAIKRAYEISKLMPKEGYSLPFPIEGKKVDEFSGKVASLGFEDLVGVIDEALSGIKSERARPMIGEVSREVEELVLMNSNGVEVRKKSTTLDIYVSASRGIGQGYDFWTSREFDFDPRELGKNAGKDARLMEKAKKLDYKGLIGFHPDVLSALFSPVFYAIDGEVVRRGKSPWQDKLDQIVGSRDLTIIEDPWEPFFPGTAGIDDEGVPTRKKAIVMDGVLRTFIYDTRAANLAGTESTGNGFRSDFSSPVGIGLTNVRIDHKQREPLSDFDNYLFIKSLMGYHNMNEKTGDFSLTVDTAFLHQNGQVTPVKGSMIVGNVFSLLKSLELASDEDFRRGDFLSPVLFSQGKIAR